MGCLRGTVRATCARQSLIAIAVSRFPSRSGLNRAKRGVSPRGRQLGTINSRKVWVVVAKFDRSHVSPFCHSEIQLPTPTVGSPRGNNLSSSTVTAEKLAWATELRGCITTSHPGAISRRCSLNISRRRRRIRLRSTAFPTAFFTLHPNRLNSRRLGRRKTVNSRLDLRRPSLYTASYSARCRRRQVRGKLSDRGSDAREAMAPFLPALRKDFSSALTLHACAKAVFFVTAAHMRLVRPFRQRCFSSVIPDSIRCRERPRLRLSSKTFDPHVLCVRNQTREMPQEKLDSRLRVRKQISRVN